MDSIVRALTLAVVAGAILIAGAVPAVAGPSGPSDAGRLDDRDAAGRRQDRRPENRLELRGPIIFGFDRLDLTDEQRQRIRTISRQHHEDLQIVAERIRAARRALRTAVAREPADESLIRQRYAEAAAVETDAVVLRARLQADLLAVLTPDQRRTLDELRAERERRLEERRQRFEQRREQRRQRRQEPPGRHSFFTRPTHGCQFFPV